MVVGIGDVKKSCTLLRVFFLFSFGIGFGIGIDSIEAEDTCGKVLVHDIF